MRHNSNYFMSTINQSKHINLLIKINTTIILFLERLKIKF
ncbi:hypothetical protein SNSL254_A0035 [Salmonella enterica subsp. enterica serovar Newport str. SL254]|uniref:Uncharacterized protein n=2 Tax=Salmonella enterica I TaxID=59201 RepID=M7RH43_SALDU|nr:hypothetical protein SNSL254_A0035 [Salmonella enterica subsp. enterica serovar Newport str. SL254]EMR51038.1 hypothetical protein A670_03711 [Salmonella enterica subsp. enterica serovar Dublin str. UC16]EPI64176.1 hypothetical protein A671_04804 [Salmonella enterica subsp. enterica serovar Dublin str. DG22]EPI77410.1 hypothetical protein A672_00545 [Salmonella enterica subsp. enterica serovar Enteritidis str. 08-1080]EPI80461.1 hypothetical protein A676_03775 [Salmonella enterica subsp. ent